MGFVNMNLTNVPDREILAEGVHTLRIVKAEEVESTSKPGQVNIRVLLEAVGEMNAEPIFHYIALVQQEDDEKKALTKMRMAKGFLDTFGVDYSEEGWDTSDLAGLEAECNVTVEEYEGRETNKLKIKA